MGLEYFFDLEDCILDKMINKRNNELQTPLMVIAELGFLYGVQLLHKKMQNSTPKIMLEEQCFTWPLCLRVSIQ